jgi:hypothetical protein
VKIATGKYSDPNRNIMVDITDEHSFTLQKEKKKKQLSLRRFSRTSLSLNKLLRVLLNRILFKSCKMHKIGENSIYARHVKYAFHHAHFLTNRMEM